MAAMTIVFCVSWDCVEPKNGYSHNDTQIFSEINLDTF